MPSQITVYLVTSGDLRLSANLVCWPAQEELERNLTRVFADAGATLVRAFPVDPSTGHGFISSQRMGMDVFESIPANAMLVFATAAWQYTHHVLAGLRSHRGPILTVANWSGQWPGLVGLLNLNGSLIKAGVTFSTVWSRSFDDVFFLETIATWLRDGIVVHDTSHVREFELTSDARLLGERLAAELRKRKAILGIFDEGCMGMYNAIIDDELLNPAGIYKERLSQSALVAAMRVVDDTEARDVYDWLVGRGVQFSLGSDEATELTEAQVLIQCKMYIAVSRMAHTFGCDAVGIQYQQGLKDLTPASDLVEGLLNNADRPPVFAAVDRSVELYAGAPLPHFNEVDEGAAVDALVTQRVWSALGWDPSSTLHDVRWGEHYSAGGLNEFVWVLQISGAAPPNHFIDGFHGATSDRQPAMYFPLGGGTLKGVSKPGPIVWSRVFVEAGALHADLGIGHVVELPASETARRWAETTPQWPIMHATFPGISRDQFMARHRANHVSVVYTPDAAAAIQGLLVKAAMLAALGINVHQCGNLPSADQPHV